MTISTLFLGIVAIGIWATSKAPHQVSNVATKAPDEIVNQRSSKL